MSDAHRRAASIAHAGLRRTVVGSSNKTSSGRGSARGSWMASRKMKHGLMAERADDSPSTSSP